MQLIELAIGIIDIAIIGVLVNKLYLFVFSYNTTHPNIKIQDNLNSRSIRVYKYKFFFTLIRACKIYIIKKGLVEWSAGILRS